MGAIFSTFGIDWHLLLINAINFGLLLAGLTFFLYKPVGNLLEERRLKVAKGVEDAEAARKALEDIESSRLSTLAKAGEEADSMLAHSRQTAASKAKEIMGQAEAAAARAIADAEKQGDEIKVRAIEESKQEVAKMIVLGMEKLAKQK
jgi:F-type H+-transporting ATPase subunit b